MGTTNPNDSITRRKFLGLSSVALASAGLIRNANAAKSALSPQSAVDSAKPDPVPLANNIALEEHFVLPETIDTSYAVRDLRLKLNTKSLTSAADASRRWIAAVSTSASFR